MPDVPVLRSNVTEAQARAGLLRYKPLEAVFNAVLDLVFPPRCAGCGRPDSVWCSRCQAQAETIAPLLALPLRADLDGYAATGVHEGVLQEAVHALKYEHARSAALPLGERLAGCLSSIGWHVDVVVPVPIHIERWRERGYNQAELIAQEVAQRVGLPCRSDLLWRVRATRSQVGLSASERRENMKDAFAARAEGLQGQEVLLIDDVFTTGATLGGCAEAMRKVGAVRVYALTVTAALGS